MTIALLAEHSHLVPQLAAWYKTEWPHWYGPGGQGNAEDDLLSYANKGSLPVGVVALRCGIPCGVAALKAESLPSHAHLSPWAAGGYVAPSLRGQGIGAALLNALEREARLLGFTKIFCGTSTAASLLLRSGWSFLEAADREGAEVAIYAKAL
ncbi:MAG: GNAT family N-acetyltransferase [Rhodocyclaceae bacterium]